MLQSDTYISSHYNSRLIANSNSTRANSKMQSLFNKASEYITNRLINFFFVQESEIENRSEEPTFEESISNQYELQTAHQDSQTSILPADKIGSKIKEKKAFDLSIEKRMIAIIQASYFESGIWTDADEYFEALINNSDSIDKPLSVLSNIVNHNIANEHILEGVLHILSNYDYEDISPFGITISLACAVNQSPIIQDLLISCFESWRAIDSITILKDLDLKEKWLAEYRDKVIEIIESSVAIAKKRI